jgi:hypothetical protein
VAVVQEDPLSLRLIFLSSRLHAQMQEFAEHGTLSSPPADDRSVQSTERVLFEKLMFLIYWLDGETLRHIGEPN